MITLTMSFNLVIAAVLQAVWPLWDAAAQAKMPILIALVIYYALNFSTTRSILVALLAGFLHDASSLIPFGLSSSAFCVVAFTLSRYRDEMYITHAVTQAFCGLAAVVFVTLFLFVGLRSAGLIELPARWLLLKCAGTGVLGMLATPVVCALARALDERLGNVERMGW